MVLFEVNVTDYVVVNNCIFSSSIKPWLFLWVVWPIFQPLQLVAEVQNIVGLLVAKSAVLVFCQYIDGILLLKFLDL